MKCPECGSRRTYMYKTVAHKHGYAHYWRCRTCRAEWQTG